MCQECAVPPLRKTNGTGLNHIFGTVPLDKDLAQYINKEDGIENQNLAHFFAHLIKKNLDFRETNFQSLPHLVLLQKTSLRRNSIIQKKMNQKNHKNDSRRDSKIKILRLPYHFP